MMKLELKNRSKSYGEGDAKTNVLSNIDLSIDDGEFVAIVGFFRVGQNDPDLPHGGA